MDVGRRWTEGGLKKRMHLLPFVSIKLHRREYSQPSTHKTTDQWLCSMILCKHAVHVTLATADTNVTEPVSIALVCKVHSC